MPYAFNVPFAELGDREYNSNLLGAAFTGEWQPAAELVGGVTYAYAFEWMNTTLLEQHTVYKRRV